MTARWNSECAICLIQKYLTDYPDDTPEEKRLEYMNRLFSAMAAAKPEEGAPVITEYIEDLQKELFGCSADYTEIKHRFNQLMLEQEAHIASRIADSEEPLRKAIQYVMTGNYIDFGALDHVDGGKLFELLSAADTQAIEEAIYQELYHDLEAASSLAYITDNCGEIVLDKLFIRTIQSQFPSIHVDVIVRGKPAVNDATIEDAIQVGLTKLPNVNVVGNGTGIPGTFIPKLSEEARHIVENADLLISKGQGNFETLRGCGLNVYYLFLCKCHLFTKRFHKKQYEGILTNDKYC